MSDIIKSVFITTFSSAAIATVCGVYSEYDNADYKRVLEYTKKGAVMGFTISVACELVEKVVTLVDPDVTTGVLRVSVGDDTVIF